MSDTNIHALPIGHTFDGYRILRLLGAGGFGITYLAEEVQIGRKVAIKEYLPQGFAARAADSFTVRAVSTSSQPQFAWGLDRFRKEAATLVAFEHPNIVSVYRYFEANGTAYLVMQYVEGKPLDALLAGGKTLTESEIEEVIHPILDGLEQVHAAHFLHRDIKPANIYIRRDGRPVLLDFGAARQAFGSETKSITAIVSEGYAPFEQYEAKGDQGPWTDVYALGAVIYRCLAGERPPAAPERVSARLRGAADPMVPAREAGAGRYSARILEAADRALSVMQADRPQTIAALRQLLTSGGTSRVASGARDGAGAAPSVLAGGATMNVRPAAAKRKNRVPLLAGGAGAVAAAAIAAYFVLAPAPPPPITAAAPSAPPAAVESAAEAAAERAAQEAAAKAEADLAALTAAIQRGELVRGKTELPGLRARIEQALGKRPNHAGLRRLDAAVRAAETDLAQRIAARVKELGDAAERDATDGDKAERSLAEIEQLDAAAAKAARGRVEQIRRAAREKSRDAEKIREEAEKRRAEEQKRAEEERRARQARQAQVDLHVSLARYHLEQATSAAREKHYAEARRTLEQVGVQLRRATDLGKGGAEPAAVAGIRRDLAAFERDLAKKIADHVAGLVIEARRLAGAEKFDEALRLLDEAAELEPASAAVADARKAAETARRQAADEARRRAEAETRKRSEAEALARIARQRLDQAKAALQAMRLAEARRMADDAAGTAREASRIAGDLAPVAAVQRDIEAFQRDLARRIAARVAELVQEARTHIKAGRFDDADRSLDEAESLDSSSELAGTARREYTAARKEAEDRRRAEDEARRRREAEDERRKKEEAARPTDPDAAERERTRATVRRPVYDPRARRGAAYFAFGEHALEGAALAVLQRGADAARAEANARLMLACGYDQLEVKDAAEGQKLARGRCEAAQQEAARRGLAPALVRFGYAAPGKGPEYRRVAFFVQADKPPETAKAPEPAARPGAYQLAGRTGSLSRISPERRAVMRIHLQFGSGGTMGVSCVAELADGGQSGCFGQANGTGTWSLTGTTLCLASAVINLAARTCYQVSGAGNQVVLSGPGILAGAMFLR